MTAKNIVARGKRSKDGNNVDNPGRRPKPKFDDSDYEKARFVRCDWNKWEYKIDFIIDCPTFILAPGTNRDTGQFGQIARCGDNEIFFPQGTSPQEIAQKLDNAILGILRADHQVYVYDEAEKVVLSTKVDFQSGVYWANRLKELRSFGVDVGLYPDIEPVQTR